MTITHLSHFGLEIIGQTNDSVVFVGQLGACKQMAAAHGMEIERYEGFVVSSGPQGATFTPANPKNFSRIWFRDGGMIQRGRDNFTLVMPRKLWEKD
jgi:hypothetical protein